MYSSTPTDSQPEMPANPTAGSSLVPASPPYQQAPSTVPLEGSGMQAPGQWMPPYSAYPPSPYGNGMPPYGGGMPPTGSPRGRGAGRIVATVLVVLLLLVLGGGIGAAVASSRASISSSNGKIVVGATSAPAVTVSSSTNTLQQDLESVAKAVQPSVVEITSTGSNEEAIGSGNILTSDGYIVTNDHVVTGFTNYTVTLSDGTNKTATLVGEDPDDDLAVIKIAATNLKPIAIGDSSKLTVGQFAIAVGTPLGLRNTTTFGIVSALNRTASEGRDGPAAELTGLIQTSAQINPGNSGGALVNLSGQLIGIPTLSETNTETGGDANGIGYAISSNQVSTVATQIIQHGSVTSSGHGFLGIEGQDVTPDVAAANGLSVQSGVLIQGFANDAAGVSPAQQAGIQAGDVITAVDGTPISNSDDLASAVLAKSPGTQVTVTIVRGTSQQNVKITLGARPANS